MTSYVLLALLSGPTMPGFGLDYSTGIVRWLAQQQNPYGGFASTQVLYWSGRHLFTLATPLPIDATVSTWPNMDHTKSLFVYEM